MGVPKFQKNHRILTLRGYGAIFDDTWPNSLPFGEQFDYDDRFMKENSI